MKTSLSELVIFLDSALKTEIYTDPYYPNGLQLDSQNHEIKKVVASVDSGESIIDKAIELKADLLIVHHGLISKKEFQIPTKTHGRKIAKLIKAGCSLYCSHLPLDGHLELGNAAVLAKLCNFKNIEPYFDFDGKGSTIGIKAKVQNSQNNNEQNSKEVLTLAEITSKISIACNNPSPLVLPFGAKNIATIGIVTGSGASAIQEAADAQLDLLISGEAKQSAYHDAKENNINVIFAGHYATETFGVKALLSVLQNKFNVETEFIDEPTGI